MDRKMVVTSVFIYYIELFQEDSSGKSIRRILATLKRKQTLEEWNVHLVVLKQLVNHLLINTSLLFND